MTARESSRLKRFFIISLHALLVLFAYTSPFWLDWRLVIAGISLYWLQLAIFSHCILSTAQFGDKETTFHEWYLGKLGIHLDHTMMKRLLNTWIPIFLTTLSITLQLLLGHSPLIHL